jgi:prephenate dehydrogenase
VPRNFALAGRLAGSSSGARMFGKVAIIGPGLIGASVGLALRRHNLADSVIGIGRREVSLQKALDIGAVGSATLDVAEGVADAGLVVLATPTSAFQHVLAAAVPALHTDSVLTDVASTKVRVVATVTSALRERPDIAYMPTHPMAGSERSGPLAARADLFEGSVCILTPMTNTYPTTKSTIKKMWETFGARTVSMSPQLHDALVARISHVPHLVAAALMLLVREEDALLGGGGLRDTTRIASADPELWLGICRDNREQIRLALDQYGAILREMSDSLKTGDLGKLEHMLDEAKSKRDRTTYNRRALRD